MIPKPVPKNPHIYIFGPLVMQNEFLAGWITQETDIKCWCSQDTDIAKAINQQGKGQILIFWDCMGKGLNTIWSDLGAKFCGDHMNCTIALFNVSPQIDINIEKQAIERGICGLFSNNCPRSLLLKGIKVILNGELWFSRRAMSEMLLNFKNNDTVPPDLENPLTPREKEILLCILMGTSTDQIAFDLNISPKTVKSHLYNIFKKINVSSRLQATLWAAKNL